MSNRPAVASAFDNLKPTIVRTPSRTPVTADAEARLLETNSSSAQEKGSAKPPGKDRIDTQPVATTAEVGPSAEVERTALPGRALLTKKRRDILVPVTFRMPQSLKEKLEKAAKLHEINQTDLINEAIDLNLQRYQ
jgi:hypothetical protein